MAHSKQALKRARQGEKNRVINKAKLTRMRGAMKKLLALVEVGDKSKASTLLATVCKAIDKAAETNVIHKNNAARHKGQMMRAVAKMK
ncbi:MAG: 30S ribosomal protein S20 [Planctomycetes bacterium]|nr:30S ribosomal protein S20 [Planctomycetota bacterium]